MITPVILCGGSGTRLWPLSRTGFPKQFLMLGERHSLFQQAAQRLSRLDLPGLGAPVIVSNEEHRFLALEQLREVALAPQAVLLEPKGRNTAPALTMAALAALEAAAGEDPVLVVTPADQHIANAEAFTAAVSAAVAEAERGAIAVLGITPTLPHTGYGYIKAGARQGEAFAVDQFVEKPDLATARRYLDAGGYYWNAGMFVLKASVWLDAIARLRPDIHAATRLAWDRRTRDETLASTFVRPGRTEFAAIPAESIDYAVIEKCPGALPIVMIPLESGWNDLGSWDALWKLLPKDADGNAQVGDVLMADTRDCLAYSTGRLVSLVGVKDVAVVETSDAVLVVSLHDSQKVKQIVDTLAAEGRAERTLHRKVHRPWGWYDSIDEGDRFKVKRILVQPGASLSLQKHHHRAEHWVVVRGTAEVTNGEHTLLLTENQSTYIAIGSVHRLSNPGSIPLEIIEVQSGSYLEEDDIVRLQDTYGRSGGKSQ